MTWDKRNKEISRILGLQFHIFFTNKEFVKETTVSTMITEWSASRHGCFNPAVAATSNQ